MLDHSTWKILHLVGIGLLFMSIGGLSLNALAGGSKESLKGKGWKLVLISREFGIVLTLVSALGMLSGIEGWSKQGWIHAKFTLLLAGVGWGWCSGQVAACQLKYAVVILAVVPQSPSLVGGQPSWRDGVPGIREDPAPALPDFHVFGFADNPFICVSVVQVALRT